MPFSFFLQVDVPASTAEADAVRDTRQLPAGAVIDAIALHVPSGHDGLVPVVFEYDGAQLVPTQQAKPIRVSGVPDLELLTGPIPVDSSGELALAAWNEDTVNQHTVSAFVRGRYRREVSRGDR